VCVHVTDNQRNPRVNLLIPRSQHSFPPHLASPKPLRPADTTCQRHKERETTLCCPLPSSRSDEIVSQTKPAKPSYVGRQHGDYNYASDQSLESTHGNRGHPQLEATAVFSYWPVTARQSLSWALDDPHGRRCLYGEIPAQTLQMPATFSLFLSTRRLES